MQFKSYSEKVPLVENLPHQLESTGLPKSACLGVLGVPGASAFIGLLKVARAKPVSIALDISITVLDTLNYYRVRLL